MCDIMPDFAGVGQNTPFWFCHHFWNWWHIDARVFWQKNNITFVTSSYEGLLGWPASAGGKYLFWFFIAKYKKQCHISRWTDIWHWFVPLLCLPPFAVWHPVTSHVTSCMTPPTLVGIPHSGFLSPSLDRGIPTQVEAGTKHDVIAWINNNGSVMMWFWRKLPQIYVRSKLVFSS